MTNTLHSKAVLRSRTYTSDAASQVSMVVEGDIDTSYYYDAVGQLTGESKVGFSMDDNGPFYKAAYSYDANGNRTSRTVNSVTESYTYDGAYKLTAISGGANPSSSATMRRAEPRASCA